MGPLVYFYIDGIPAAGRLTGRDYEEIEVTTDDGEKYYMSDEWLSAPPHES